MTRKQETERPCCLYLIAGKNRVKIGISVYPEDRLRALQLETYETLQLEASVVFATQPEAVEAERTLHSLCASWALGGEWFQEPAREIFRNVHPGAEIRSDRANVRPESSFQTGVRMASEVFAKTENGDYVAIPKTEALYWYRHDPFRPFPYWRWTEDRKTIVIGEIEPPKGKSNE